MTLQQRAAEVAKKASDQHGKIRGALITLAVTVERCSTASDPSASIPDVRVALDNVARNVERHFDAEETMRLHEHLSVLVPERASELRTLVLDHSRLRTLLRECRRLVTTQKLNDVHELRYRVERFLRRLHEHEDAEDRLMQLALQGGDMPRD